MIHWLKRLIAGRELDELERLRKERLDAVIAEQKRSKPEKNPFQVDMFRCIDCGSRYPRDELSWGLCDPCQTKAVSEIRMQRTEADVTDWDVAQAAQEPEGRVDYRFLGVMGDGQDS
jgi:hypothetical protein